MVSGGGTGIGCAVARAFARSGDRVAIVGRRSHVLERAARGLRRETGRSIAWFPADLSRPDDVEWVAKELLSELGPTVDVLVNNAGGVPGTREDGVAGVAAAWQAAFTANVLTAVLLTEALTPHLSSPGGRVVTLGSIAALRGGGVYGAAKAALHAWSFSLAAELGPQNVTVNVVAPGYTEHTELFRDAMTEERRGRLVSETLVGRAGRPEDVAAAVYYLASPEASFITGQILHVNGGALLGR